MLLKRVKKLPEGPEWMYEVKWDGYRMQALKEGERVRLLSRNGADYTRRFSEVAEAVEQLKPQTLYMDGELVAMDRQGRPSFQLLQSGRPLPPGTRIGYYAFDLLHVGARQLWARPLHERRSALRELIDGSPLRFSTSLEGTAEQVTRAVGEHGLEGVVAKRVSSVYEPGARTGSWVKLPLKQTGRFLIGGLRPAGRRVAVLLVGHYPDGVFRYAGKVSCPLAATTLADFARAIRPLARLKCPFPDLPNCKLDPFDEMVTPEEMKLFTWLNPEVVAEVAFTEWTRFGALRQPELTKVC